MPELPEVETIARTLRLELVGQTIFAADLRWARTLATPSARKFKEQIKGQQISQRSTFNL
jgi:formamidopyrimidine-DNA glycosylase